MSAQPVAVATPHSAVDPLPTARAAAALGVKLTVYRDGATVVRDAEFELPAGGAVGIAGRNGVGKTTLIHGILGTLRSEGEVRLGGEDVSRLPTHGRAARGMALVPQGRRLFPGLTVAENLRAAELGRRAGGPEIDPFELFGELRELTGRRAGVLSGGQQQQVAIARALLRRPRVLFLDEPTEGLAPALVADVTAALCRLRDSGLAIVLAEQHHGVIEAVCRNTVHLRPGELGSRAIPTAEFLQSLTDRS